jgi:serine/threonine-protein kinase
MSTQKWQELQHLVTKARQLPPAERAAFLDQACAGDDDLRSEAAALVAVASAADGFLETPAVERSDIDLPGLQSLSPGTRLGPYQIERAIGQGGMGMVYLAARADHEYEHRVAIKLLHPCFAGEVSERRFKVERQILASLQHPGIARLLDGGTTEAGQPYLVMEYVDGLPIDRYCNRNRLDVRQRIDLFLKICSAVRFAHRNLVVHRDIKPSNILVSTDGEPRLLDFGIAKPLGPGLLGGGELTASLAQPMTLQYASPEQIRGQTITTASDVYSLGVLLYKLLTGALPRAFTDTSLRSVEEVLNREPTRPSQALILTAAQSDTEDHAPFVSHSAQQVHRELTGDLDAITLKALREEPDQRYGTVIELTEDLERWQEGMPVRAAHQTFRYRLGKLYRRHRLAVLTIAAVLLMATAFTLNTVRERARAQLEANKATQVKEFLKDVFGASDPFEARGEDISARELLDRGATRIEAELQTQPEVRAEIMAVLGDVYVSLGLYDQAEPLLVQALAIRQSILDDRHVDLAASLRGLATLYVLQGRYEKAAPLHQHALKIQESELGPNHLEVSRSLNRLATMRYYEGEYNTARTLFQQAVEIAEQELGADDPGVASLLCNLATVCYELGEYDESESLHLRALVLREENLDPDSPEVSLSLNNLGNLYYYQGRYDEAEPLYVRALAIREKVYGARHPEVGTTLNNLANLYDDQGSYTKAEPLHHRTIEIWRESGGEEHPDVALAIGNLARSYKSRGRLDEAERLYLQAKAIWEKTLDESQVDLAMTLLDLGDVYADRGRYAKAEPLFAQVLDGLEHELDSDHPDVVTALVSCAHVCVKLEQYQRARSIYQRCLSIGRQWQADGPLSSRQQSLLASVLLGSGALYHEEMAYAAAEDAWQEALSLIQPLAAGPACPAYLDTYVKVLVNMGQIEQARGPLRRLSATGWTNPDLQALVSAAGL